MTSDNKHGQATSAARKYPLSVDGLPGMQYPDMPGGGTSNAPTSPNLQAHPTSVRLPVTPESLGLPKYGSTLSRLGSSYQITAKE